MTPAGASGAPATGMQGDVCRALRGVRVVDLTRLVPGPFATQILVDLGADVIKVEAPGGGDYLRFLPPLVDGMGARFRALNRGKRSVVLDLTQAPGRAALLRLVAGADVLVEGFRPGVLDRLGVGYEVAAAQNDRLVYVSISGYGRDGPYAQRAGHDLNYAALSGLLAEMVTVGGPPPRPLPVQLADLVGGGLYPVIAILAALAQRDRVGGPQYLDLSMTEGLLALLGPELADLAAADPRPAPGRGMLTGGVATYRVYETRDGRHLAVAALEPKFSERLSEVLGVPIPPDLLVAPPARQAEVAEAIANAVRQRDLSEWVERFRDVDACVEPVLRPEELAQHPQHRARGAIHLGADGRVRTDGPVSLPGIPRRSPEGQVPRLGEHTVAVLSEAGFSKEDLSELLASGAAVQWADGSRFDAEDR